MQLNKNPYLSAVLAGVYIILIALGLNWTAGFKEIQGTFFVPMFMLSLFVFSTSVMGYFFVLTPLTLYIDGKKGESVNHFLKTVATFAIWLVIFGLLALGW